ncbi:MAG: AlkA N-terminal domain-containing protein [bacterium]
MSTPTDRFYDALKSRDRRFDGRFFAGVTSTGIYCRPICPARTPKRDNVRFFSNAAAAEAAGFRPCRRCRPETAPGTPAWHGTSATVARALRLISEGELDGGSVDDLADRLGVGGRHLRRLFDRHVGASPLAVAQTRRIHFARKLLDDTDLPMRDIAFAAGFQSVKRFNTVMRETFGRSPTEIRKVARTEGQDSPEGRIELRLPYREPFDWPALLDYFAARATPGVEEVVDGEYRRSFAYDDCRGVIRVRRCEDRPCLVLSAPASARRRLMDLAERTRRLFDLGADPVPIADRLGADPVLGDVVRRHAGLRVPGAWDPFELCVRAILGQQVSVKGATTLTGRVAARHGAPLPPAEQDGGVTLLFPTPETLATAPLSDLGIPQQRIDAIRELGRRVSARELPLSWGECHDRTHLALMDVPGIGEWTAQYVAMRALGQPDTFLAGDLGVRRALENGDGMPSAAEALALSERWRPWRAYAVLYLWKKETPA